MIPMSPLVRMMAVAAQNMKSSFAIKVALSHSTPRTSMPRVYPTRTTARAATSKGITLAICLRPSRGHTSKALNDNLSRCGQS